MPCGQRKAVTRALEPLDLRDCKNLTADAGRKLQAVLPKCKIASDFSEVEPKYYNYRAH